MSDWAEGDVRGRGRTEEGEKKKLAGVWRGGRGPESAAQVVKDVGGEGGGVIKSWLRSEPRTFRAKTETNARNGQRQRKGDVGLGSAFTRGKELISFSRKKKLGAGARRVCRFFV